MSVLLSTWAKLPTALAGDAAEAASSGGKQWRQSSSGGGGGGGRALRAPAPAQMYISEFLDSTRAPLPCQSREPQ